MKVSYKIVPYKKVFPILRKSIGSDFYSKYSYRVETNRGLVFELPDKTIFLPKNSHDCIIYQDKEDLKKMIETEEFPLEEPEFNPFAREKERILNFQDQTEHYHSYLNDHLGFRYENINDKSIEAYFSKIIGRTIKKVAHEKETIAIISLVGSIFKELYPSKWFVSKQFGTYNAYYEPSLLTNMNRVIPVTDIIESKLKWKLKEAHGIFNGLSFQGKSESDIGEDFEQYSRNRNVTLIE